MRKTKKKVQMIGILTVGILFVAGSGLIGGCMGKKEALTLQKSGEAEDAFQKIEVNEKELTGKYYYEKLDKEKQKAYKEMLQGIEKNQKEIYVHLADPGQVNRIFEFIMNDFPEIFWCSGKAETTSYRQKKEGYSVFCPVYLYNEREKEQMRQDIERETKACLDGFQVKTEDTEYEIIRYVYEYLIRTVDYAKDAKDSQNIYSALVRKQSVCAGYARATQYLLEKMGVFCTYVTGVTDGQPHAWNLVRCDNDYYYVDTTWGDPVFRQEEDEEKIPQEQKIQYDYLCCNDEELFRTHIPDKTVELPACTSLDKNYYVKTGRYYQRYDDERIRRQFREDIAGRSPVSVFKFASKETYLEASKNMIDGMIKQAAGNLAKWYGLSRVQYSYQDDSELYKITVYWQYE